ncbi:aldehyde dehydrogenase family protein [Pseudenhygromyxa sp. WMMC2535]|uniref:aldehyde dehydrogenase family protein n=1 Tax=Pseudenhygromyxa sp. WMMC2535 TaxID=2712867 RepID=UPI001555877C|nr:aldehyde dehydrogenase family protein [Pseudenhygromyxa sp. WMMC2535]NVB42826.1 aldehyde dehydrogenase family protein [Pseudenhygromyxa sp. WMMC2535]
MSEAAQNLDQQVHVAIPCIDPGTGERLGEVPALTAEQVREEVARARKAQAEWARTSFAERRRVLRHLLDMILEHSDALCEEICRDAGKTMHNAMLGEIWPIAEKLRWTIAEGEKHLRTEVVSSGLLKHKRAKIEYQPLGVIGVITPWNFPLQNILGPTIPALFAGNAVVVKVSEWTSWSAAPFQGFLERCFADCGYSKDLVRVITGYGDAGAALVSGGVDKIVFTGSMANGRRVVEESAKTLTPVILELGGKDPMIVCDDADLEQAAHAAASAAFIASGQMCLAAERVLVFDAIYDDFVARVQDIALRLRQGAPLAGKLVDIGAMTMPGQLDIVDALVEDAFDKGASLKAGGTRAKRKPSKNYYEPTVIADVTEDMRIMHEETFGPVLAICRVKNEAEAIRVANATEYGLSSSVFSKDHARARRIADQIVAGSTCINDWALAYMVQDLPFGGVKGSGYGRLNGREGLRACSNIKAVIEDRLPLHRAIELFPGRHFDYEVTREGVRLLYTQGLVNKFDALVDLGRAVVKRATT